MKYTRFTSAAVASVSVALGLGFGTPAFAAGNTKTADIIMSTLNNPFFVSLKNGVQAEAAKDGFTLNVQNANNSTSRELNLATTDLVKQPALLILDPTSSTAATSIVHQANAANVPVMAFDRKPASGKLETFIGYDGIKAGERAAKALAKGLHGKGKVVEIEGIMGTNVAQNRHKGFREEIAKYPNIHVVATQSANFDRGTALNVMTNVLQAHPDIDGVYAANDEMAMGVLAALQSKNKAGKVVLVGNDGIKDALEAISNGQMYATNAESPYEEGLKVADLAEKIMHGRSVPTDKTLEGTLVSKKNVEKYAQHLMAIGDSADVPASLQK